MEQHKLDDHTTARLVKLHQQQPHESALSSWQNLRRLAEERGLGANIGLVEATDGPSFRVAYTKNGQDTAIESTLYANGKAVTTHRGERQPGTGPTADAQWQADQFAYAHAREEGPSGPVGAGHQEQGTLSPDELAIAIMQRRKEWEREDIDSILYYQKNPKEKEIYDMALAMRLRDDYSYINKLNNEWDLWDQGYDKLQEAIEKYEGPLIRMTEDSAHLYLSRIDSGTLNIIREARELSTVVAEKKDFSLDRYDDENFDNCDEDSASCSI